MGQFPIFLKLSGTVIYCAVLFIGISFVDQCLDELNHPADLFCGKGMGGGRFHIHASHILFALLNVTLADHLCGSTFFDSFFDNFVIYVRKVGYIIHIISFIFQVPSHRIKYDHRAGIANVDQVVYSRTAYIHLDLSFF